MLTFNDAVVEYDVVAVYGEAKFSLTDLFGGSRKFRQTSDLKPANLSSGKHRWVTCVCCIVLSVFVNACTHHSEKYNPKLNAVGLCLHSTFYGDSVNGFASMTIECHSAYPIAVPASHPLVDALRLHTFQPQTCTLDSTLSNTQDGIKIMLSNR